MAQLFTNNATGSLASSITNVATSIVLGTGQGAKFPAIAGGNHFFVTLVGLDANGNENAWEIVKVTARTTDTLTVVRGQESTTAVAWATGSKVDMRATAGTYSALLQTAGGTMTGNLLFSGNGLVIGGDLSNATASLRMAFQTTTVNGNTIVTAKPNGTGTGAYFIAHNAADADNSAYLYMSALASEAVIRADKLGTGSYLNIGLYANAARQAQVIGVTGAVNYITLAGGTTGANATIGVTGSDASVSMILQSKGAGSYILQDNNGARAFMATPVASAVNYLQAASAVTTAAPFLTAAGSDANISMVLASKGSGNVILQANSATALATWNPASAVNAVIINGNTTGYGPGIGATGSDANIDLNLAGKGTGAVVVTSSPLSVKTVNETVYTLTGTAISAANGGIQTKAIAANTTFTDSLTAGQSVILMLTSASSYTITWPTMTWVRSVGNVAPTLTASDTVVLWKVGSTLYGAYVGSGA